jgi:isoleucyl-tRNA synthetase
MTEVFAEVTDAFETYQFFRFFQTVQNFCIVDLSNFYLDIAKDRLYISSENAQRRRSCQTVLAIALENLCKAIAPVLSHLAEDIWQFIPYETDHKSVFAAGWVNLDESWTQPDLAEKWTKLRELRTESNKVLEQARTAKEIGSSLAAKLLVYTHDPAWRSVLNSFNLNDRTNGNNVDELRYLLLVSQVELVDSIDRISGMKFSTTTETFGIGVADVEGVKCDRCWNYSTHVGTSELHPLLCDRCVDAIDGEF